MSILRYEQVDTADYAGMFKWFEETTFPDPAGARETLRQMSFGLYPGAIKAAMAVFDVVESIAVSRTRVCAAGGIHALTRIQVCDGAELWSSRFFQLCRSPRAVCSLSHKSYSCSPPETVKQKQAQ